MRRLRCRFRATERPRSLRRESSRLRRARLVAHHVCTRRARASTLRRATWFTRRRGGARRARSFCVRHPGFVAQRGSRRGAEERRGAENGCRGRGRCTGAWLLSSTSPNCLVGLGAGISPPGHAPRAPRHAGRTRNSRSGEGAELGARISPPDPQSFEGVDGEDACACARSSIAGVVLCASAALCASA